MTIEKVEARNAASMKAESNLYVDQEIAAYEVYHKIKNNALAEYMKIVDTALVEYNDMKDVALAEYTKRGGQDWGDEGLYMAIERGAWADYQKTKAQAFKAYMQVKEKGRERVCFACGRKFGVAGEDQTLCGICDADLSE